MPRESIVKELKQRQDGTDMKLVLSTLQQRPNNILRVIQVMVFAASNVESNLELRDVIELHFCFFFVFFFVEFLTSFHFVLIYIPNQVVVCVSS